jgi:TPP-dependent pyruvate/acetoin dehydrogenase alpha subunit
MIVQQQRRDNQLVSLYREMLRIRRVEEAIVARYPEQQMRCPVHLSIGQEGVAVGVSAALRSDDYMISTHRGHAHYLAKGGDLRAFIAELYGRETGCSGGRGGSMHIVDRSVGMIGSTPIVGGSLPIAVGTAFATRLDGGDRVTVVYFGDGTTEEGVFLEALNFAALKTLNVLFVCENNAYSVYSPLSVRQHPNRSRAGIAAANGLATACGDGNDVVAVRDATLAAVARARNGGGPTFLEFETFRHREHCGPNFDDELGYRDPAFVASWLARDPVMTLERALLADGTLDASTQAEIASELRAEIEDAFAFAIASPFPPASELFRHIFAEDV